MYRCLCAAGPSGIINKCFFPKLFEFNQVFFQNGEVIHKEGRAKPSRAVWLIFSMVAYISHYLKDDSAWRKWTCNYSEVARP